MMPTVVGTAYFFLACSSSVDKFIKSLSLDKWVQVYYLGVCKLTRQNRSNDISIFRQIDQLTDVREKVR